jgi:hypothetical protein
MRGTSSLYVVLARVPAHCQSATVEIVRLAGPAHQYDHGVASFLESAGITLTAAFLTACWHILARNEKPEAQELFG